MMEDEEVAGGCVRMRRMTVNRGRRETGGGGGE